MIDNIRLSTLKNFVRGVEKTIKTEDPAISFECLAASLYPQLLKNTLETIRNARTEGYIDGVMNNWNTNNSNVSLKGFETAGKELGECIERLIQVLEDINESLDEAKDFLAPVNDLAQSNFVNLMLPRANELKEIYQKALEIDKNGDKT